jgi:hypothetical protein
MAVLRTDQVPLFSAVTVDGDSALVDVNNAKSMTLLAFGSSVGTDVTLTLLTVDASGNEYTLNSAVLTGAAPVAVPVIFSGQYVNVLARLSGISAGTYDVFLNVQRDV